MTGILYLIPNVLIQTMEADSDALGMSIPAPIQALTASLDYFVAENAKTTRAFLKQIAVSHPLATPLQDIRIAELNVKTPSSALPALLAPLQKGCNAGLISEAGVPAVADPGANLVLLAHQHGITVKPLTGPSSLLLALMGSGLNGQSFAFNGYLPVDAPSRQKRIRQLEERSRQENQTQLFIETPYRNTALLQALALSCGETTWITVATGLTGPTETIQTRTAGDWRQRLASELAPDLHKKPTVFLLLAA